MSGTVAFVLSGGGAKGDFQLGALRYLYNQGIRPDILIGTSVGAINAAKLAEGENPSDPTRGLSGLEAIWSTLKVNTDMYQTAPWLFDSKMDKRIRNFILGCSEDLGIEKPIVDKYSWGWLSGAVQTIRDIAFLFGEGKDVLESLGVILEKSHSIYNLKPIEEKLKVHLNHNHVKEWVDQGHKLRISMVGLSSGKLRFFTEEGKLVERDGTPARGIVREELSPDCAKVYRLIEAAEGNRRALQSQLQTAAPGEKRFILEEIAKVNQELAALYPEWEVCQKEQSREKELVPGFTPAALRGAVMASASIPVIFPPVGFSTEYMVDGGARDILPLKMAVNLGSTTIYAIHTSKRVPDPSNTAYGSANIVEILMRTLSILVDEVIYEDQDVQVPSGTQVIHIFPGISLHDSLTIDPGLIQISRDYGFMVASDVVDNVDPYSRRWELGKAISWLRRTIWQLENEEYGQIDPTRPCLPPKEPKPVKGGAKKLKNQLKTLVEERRQLGGPVPLGIERWFELMELHPWKVEFDNDAGYVRHSIPTTIHLNTSAEVSVTMINNGFSTWKPVYYKLQLVENAPLWMPGSISVPHDVSQGEEVTFVFTITPRTPGNYVFQWRMMHSATGGGWFGESTPEVGIQVPASSSDECQLLQSRLKGAEDLIKKLQEDLIGKSGPERRMLLKEIDDIRSEIEAINNRMRELGC